MNQYSIKNSICLRVSCGVLLYTLVTHKYPLELELSLTNPQECLYRRNYFKHLNMNRFVKFTNKLNYSEEIIDFINHMLVFKDDKRLDVNELLNHKWIK